LALLVQKFVFHGKRCAVRCEAAAAQESGCSVYLALLVKVRMRPSATTLLKLLQCKSQASV
jgi:hypothetical protein